MARHFVLLRRVLRQRDPQAIFDDRDGPRVSEPPRLLNAI